MNKRTIGAFAAALGLVGVLMLSGCSDDDKGTNSSGDLTAQEQYAIMSDLLFAQKGPVDGGFLTLAAGFIEANYWDGISEDDFTNSGARTNYSTAASDIDSLSYAYNPLSGWWHIYFEQSGIQNGANTTEVRSDSVRFETATGQAQAVPDEDTRRIRGGANFLRHANKTTEERSYDVELLLHGTYVIDLNPLTGVTLNGTSAGECTIAGLFPDSSLTLHVETSTDVDDVVILPEVDECPSSGDVTCTLGAVLDATLGEDEIHAESDWDIMLTFLADCLADVEYNSGSTHITEQIELDL